jgi:predicted nucleic acid-binding protein
MYLIDTSVLVSAFTKEDASEAVLQWFATNATAPLAINDWTSVEFASALMIKVRDGRISAASQQAILLEFRTRRRAFQSLEVTREHFQLAERLCERSKFGIRSGDALHAAVALLADAWLVTRDKALIAASGAYGLKCVGI